ncbi:MAG: carbon-nitrogen hydrolase family protein [Methanomicrobiales archaeon]|jgi:predicted amidohydrolase|nr:carbon-nitrogen hydrolase family protein [Methanomicrobiales archaeon]
MEQMRIALAQTHPLWNDPDASFSLFYQYASDAKAKGASLIAFPEQAATGWDPTDNQNFIESIDGSIVSQFREIARDIGIAVLGSFREQSEHFPRNTAVLIDKHGEILLSYSKKHLFYPAHEDRYFSPGEKDQNALAIIDGFSVGVAICFDLRFCEVFCRYQMAGAELILLPIAWPVSTIQYMSLFARCRAVENNCYIGCVNNTGVTPVNTYTGESVVFSPQGECVCSAGSDETLIIAELTKEAFHRRWNSK